MITTLIPEHHVEGKRLGRHLQHDPKSWNYQAARAPQLVTTVHARKSKAFDQGNLGSCTGNAITGCLDTKPFTHARLGERTAVRLYEHATIIDGYPGQYPPDDTGTSGLAIAKAAKFYDYITTYRHAFGLQHALEALVIAPWIMGINWYDSMDSPDSNGFISITTGASVRGGHELEVSELNVEGQYVEGWQSWGDWGPLHGKFRMSFEVLDRLLGEGGDVTTFA